MGIISEVSCGLSHESTEGLTYPYLLVNMSAVSACQTGRRHQSPRFQSLLATRAQKQFFTTTQKCLKVFKPLLKEINEHHGEYNLVLYLLEDCLMSGILARNWRVGPCRDEHPRVTAQLSGETIHIPRERYPRFRQHKLLYKRRYTKKVLKRWNEKASPRENEETSREQVKIHFPVSQYAHIEYTKTHMRCTLRSAQEIYCL